jgi:coenzyme F420-reducing hydrogenase beta subunit
MQPNSQGFLYPKVNESKCINCERCVNVCPYLQNEGIGANLFPHTLVYAAKHTHQIRKESSSGGIFTLISDMVLSKKGIVYGVAFDSNMIVRHMRAETLEERDTFRGSKYVQSDLGTIFQQIKSDLKTQRLVLFTGTPCQVAGLRLFLGHSYKNLITIDVVCHGVPSPKVFSSYLQQLEKITNDKVVNLRFRDKSNGWKTFLIEISYRQKGKQYISQSESTFFELFINNIILRECCYECKFTNFNRPADFTLGDYWGIENVHPLFFDDFGISLVLINSQKGNRIWKQISEYVEAIPSTHDNCLQGPLVSPSKHHIKQTVFWSKYSKQGYSAIAKKISRPSKKKQIKKTFSRVIKSKIFH